MPNPDGKRWAEHDGAGERIVIDWMTGLPAPRADVMMYLKETIPDNRLIDSDITTTWNTYVFRQLKADPFQMSLFEQEICFRADLFLRPAVSNWSDFIEKQRRLIGKKTTRVRAIAGLDYHTGRTVSERYEKFL
ncbi:uncharacterized protein LOC144355134 [Saccoglossus kowalevskii]